jgi:drug/metabolite transporter (DMT)-like permease
MLQRIQSIYLFIAVLCGAALFLSAFNTFNFQQIEFNFSLFGLHQIKGEPNLNYTAAAYALVLFCCAFILVNGYTIFLFKNRRKQIKLAGFGILILASFCVAEFFFANHHQLKIAEILNVDIAQIQINYGIGTLMPILAMVMNFLAIRAIKKDEELVRSADRIR